MESLSNLFLEKKISSFFSALERPAFLVVQLLPLEVAEYSAAEKRRQAAYLGVVVLLSAPPNHSLEAPPVPAATPYLVVVVEAAVSFSSQQLPLGVVEGQAPPSLVVEAPPSNQRQEYSVAAAAVEPPCLAALRSGLPVRQYLVAGVAPLHLVGVSRPLAAAVEQPHWAVECSVVPLGQEFLGPAQPLRLPLDRLEARHFRVWAARRPTTTAVDRHRIFWPAATTAADGQYGRPRQQLVWEWDDGGQWGGNLWRDPRADWQRYFWDQRCGHRPVAVWSGPGGHLWRRPGGILRNQILIWSPGKDQSHF